MSNATSVFNSVYGPVESWRFGVSLGIDPIGKTSTCSFNCVYCQLGTIEDKTCDRRLFIPTERILEDLQAFAPWDVDVITLSGSGEPTLALNLGEILLSVKALTGKPVGVLTNGSLLIDSEVQRELAIADQVAVKLDAISTDQYQRINRPVPDVELLEIWEGLQDFRVHYTGHLAVQTMLLSPWSERAQAEYIKLLRQLQPDEVQLNTPTRPRPQERQLEARGNLPAYPTEWAARLPKPVGAAVLKEFADRIQQTLQIPVRYPALS